MTIAALIVAAGRGTRLGADVPKQYIPLNGACALRRSVELFLEIPDVSQVACVIHQDDQARYEHAMSEAMTEKLLHPVQGGDTRAKSVLAGLTALERAMPSSVLIHDAARPFMPVEVIERVISGLKEHDGVCAALPVVDALWMERSGMAEHSVSREELWRAQTPQGFRYDAILAAHSRNHEDSADDVVVARRAGIAVKLVQGDENGFKITTQEDLARALHLTAST